MRFNLRPRENAFYSHFQDAARNLITGTDLLDSMVHQTNDRAALADKLKQVEHASDEVTHQLFHRLNSTFVTPLDREDIYRLGTALDDVIDAIEEAGSLIALYGLAVLPAELAEMAELLRRCADVTAEAMGRLRPLKDLQSYWIEVNRLENEADQAHRRFLARLFSGTYDALTVIKLKEVGDQFEAAADAFEHVAVAVETIAVKES